MRMAVHGLGMQSNNPRETHILDVSKRSGTLPNPKPQTLNPAENAQRDRREH